MGRAICTFCSKTGSRSISVPPARPENFGVGHLIHLRVCVKCYEGISATKQLMSDAFGTERPGVAEALGQLRQALGVADVAPKMQKRFVQLFAIYG